jgi:hypothetical protein
VGSTSQIILKKKKGKRIWRVWLGSHTEQAGALFFYLFLKVGVGSFVLLLEFSLFFDLKFFKIEKKKVYRDRGRCVV